MKAHKLFFPILLFAFQILLLGLYASAWVDYRLLDTPQVTNYPSFQDIHVMIFIGFAFLMTFLHKYGYGAVAYNLLMASITIQWSILVNGWLKLRVQYREDRIDDAARIKIDVNTLINADFTATSILITFGAVLGRATRFQLFIITVIECIVFAINETIITEYIKISDAGGSIILHLFGAYFGLAVSAVLQNHGNGNENESSNYQSDIFSMIGTLFLWVYWPSFNSAPVANYPNQQNRAIINTYLSLAACVITTFVASTLLHKNYKINMVHIQNATIAGGVAIGTAADLELRPWGAILVGMTAGFISVLGFTFVTPFMRKYLKIHDSCGVNNLHGMPGIFAGIVAAIASASIGPDEYPTIPPFTTIATLNNTIISQLVNKTDHYNIYVRHGKYGQTGLVKQGGYQFAAICVSFAIGVGGGLITGLICRLVDEVDEENLFNDEDEFMVHNSSNSHAVTTLEMKATANA